MTQEIWKDVPGYEGRYFVSNLGNLRGKHRYGNIVDLKKKITNSGYIGNDLFDGEKYRKYSVHRIVMLAFVGYSKLDVNHKNGIKTDNRLENLEYCTKSQNMRHAIDNGLLKIKKGYEHHLFGKLGKDNKDSIKVKQFSIEGEFIKEWDSIADIGRELGISKGNVCMVCKGQRNHTGGYKWSY